MASSHGGTLGPELQEGSAGQGMGKHFQLCDYLRVQESFKRPEDEVEGGAQEPTGDQAALPGVSPLMPLI